MKRASLRPLVALTSLVAMLNSPNYESAYQGGSRFSFTVPLGLASHYFCCSRAPSVREHCTVLAHLPQALDVEQHFRVRSRFIFHDMITSPSRRRSS